MNAETIVAVLARQATERPDQRFLICEDDELTFREVDDRTDRVAGGLRELGINAGDRVALLTANRIEVLELYFALAKLGAIQVPLNAYLKGAFLRHQLADSAATVLIADEAGVRAAQPLLGELPDLQGIVTLDEPLRPAGMWVARYADLRQSEPARAADIASANLMSIVYTSGTTGMPKGCMLSHGYYLRTGAVMGRAAEIRADDVLLTALPLFHGAARMMVLAAGLLHGVPVVVERKFQAHAFLDRARSVGATLAFGVGAMGMALLGQPPSTADRAHRLRAFLLVPFAAGRQTEFRERFGVDAWAELFGQTECVPITWNALSGERRQASCGRASDDLEVAVLDDDNNEVPAEQVGEICLRPAVPEAMFDGYWRNPRATLDAYRGLWYHTGDFGRRDEEGFLYFVDRKKDALRRRGENVSSFELEAAILKHPKIVEAAAHAVPSSASEDDIKVCLVAAPGEQLTPAEVFAFFQENLPYFAVPRFAEVMDELPKNAVGRVMKFELRSRPLTEAVWDFTALGLEVERSQRR